MVLWTCGHFLVLAIIDWIFIMWQSWMWLVTGLSLAGSEGTSSSHRGHEWQPSLTLSCFTNISQSWMEMATLPIDDHLTYRYWYCLKYKTWFGFWNHACFIRHIHDICVNLCHLLFLCHYILFWLVQQYLKTDPGSADRHIVTLLQPVVESGLRTCAPSIDPTHCYVEPGNAMVERKDQSVRLLVMLSTSSYRINANQNWMQ